MLIMIMIVLKQVREALLLMDRMRGRDIPRDVVTFGAAMSACDKAKDRNTTLYDTIRHRNIS